MYKHRTVKKSGRFVAKPLEVLSCKGRLEGSGKRRELFDFDQQRVLFWCLAALFIGLFIGDLIFSWPRARIRDFLLGRFASQK